MIGQSIFDFFRDIILSWVSGMNTLMANIDAHGAGVAIGAASGQAGHFLALFISSGMWGGVLTAFGVWNAVWLITGLVAIIARRGAA